MIRTVFAVLFVAVYLVLTLPVLLVLFLFSKKFPQGSRLALQRLVGWAFSVVCFLSGVRLTVIGRENIPTDRPVLFVGNHQSFFDVITCFPLIKNRFAYIAKKELDEIPLLGLSMRFLGCLFIDRENLREGVKTILKAADEVKEDGTSIFIFPEGTRNKSGDELNLAEFHEGSFRVAQKGECPIIPVSFNNTANVLENHFPRIRSQRVVIEFGEPKSWDDFDKKDQRHLGVYYRDLLIEMIRKNQALVNEEAG